MKAEKIIRAQARGALKGNWVAAVSGVFTVLVFYLLVFFIFSLTVNIFDVSTENGMIKSGGEISYLLILCFTFVLVVAVSPVKNGFTRLCYKIQSDGDADFKEIFYFFSGIKIYFKAIHFNILYALRRLLCYLIAAVPYAAFTLAVGALSVFITVSADIVFVIGTVLSALGIALGFLISLRFLPAQFIFAAELEQNAFIANKYTVKGHYRDLIKLAVSFIPWALLCFFVLPALYVIPYFFTSAATSTKWLFKLYKEGKSV